jgi:hypothetical protein
MIRSSPACLRKKIWDLLNFRCLRRRLLHIFYTKITVLVCCNLCRHNLQFLVARIKNPLDNAAPVLPHARRPSRPRPRPSRAARRGPVLAHPVLDRPVLVAVVTTGAPPSSAPGSSSETALLLLRLIRGAEQRKQRTQRTLSSNNGDN